ncbi:unnamed protein product [Cunninghamella blakesleeana]
MLSLEFKCYIIKKRDDNKKISFPPLCSTFSSFFNIFILTIIMVQLNIRIGESVDTLKPIVINHDDDDDDQYKQQPTYLNTNHFKGTIDIRIKGLTHNEDYFNKSGNTFCVHIHGRFLCNSNNTTADDIIFGNEFEKSLSLPFGFSILTKFAQFIDPGLELHLYEEQPYAFSPLITTLNHLKISNIIDINNNNSNNNNSSSNDDDDDDELYCNQNTCNHPVEENCQLVEHQSILSPRERQIYFNNTDQRQKTKINSSMLWVGDFCNNYMDMLNGTIHIPGFTIDALKYYNDQPLRYICKKRDNSVVYFVIEFDLFK